MATEKRLIDANALKEKLQAHHDFFVDAWGGFSNLPPKDKARVDEITHCIAEICNAPTVDAVPAEKYNELNVRYKKMIETADILDTALRQYQRTYGE